MASALFAPPNPVGKAILTDGHVARDLTAARDKDHPLHRPAALGMPAAEGDHG